MQRVLIPLCLLMLGCDSPSLAFRGVEAQTISVGSSTFSVRVLGDRAEAIRINRAKLPSAVQVQQEGGQAIAIVSGCRIKKLTGDQAILSARLDCSG